VLTVIVTITEGLYPVLIISVTITGRSMCSLSSYCDNNRDVYMQC
jgi:hypothetical protein